MFQRRDQTRPLEERIKLCRSLMQDFPESIPTIVQRAHNETSLRQLNKRQFLVPKSMTLGALVGVIASHLGSYSNESLWLYSSRNILTNKSEVMSEIYNRCHEIDGFLYLTYRREDTFG